jgi:hypothetical protein
MIPLPWLKIAIPAAIALAGFTAGWKVQGWRCEAARASALEQAIQMKAVGDKIVADFAATYEEDRANGQIEHRTATTEIRTAFVDRVVPGDCAAPDDARRVLESGVHRANSRASGEPSGPMPEPSIAP